MQNYSLPSLFIPFLKNSNSYIVVSKTSLKKLVFNPNWPIFPLDAEFVFKNLNSCIVGSKTS